MSARRKASPVGMMSSTASLRTALGMVERQAVGARARRGRGRRRRTARSRAAASPPPGRAPWRAWSRARGRAWSAACSCRRSRAGRRTTTVKSRARRGATMCHITCVCGWPCSSSSGGPLPPWRTRMVASPVSIIALVKPSNIPGARTHLRVLLPPVRRWEWRPSGSGAGSAPAGCFMPYGSDVLARPPGSAVCA